MRAEGERVAIQPGQFWRSLDPRDNYLQVMVLRVEPTRVLIQRHRNTWINRDRFPRAYVLDPTAPQPPLARDAERPLVDEC